jgi:hypothetical protein
VRGVVLGVLAGLLVAAPASAQGIEQSCVMAVAKFDPATTNVAYPDDSAQYFVGGYQAAPGMRIRIQGRFPHARYMSFNVYDQAQRPIDGLADVGIAPAPGSSNPFAPRADRTAERRDYTVFVEFGPIPEQRAPNTLYTGTGQGGAPNFNGTFIYRIYIPDRGRDATGGVGLPKVTYEPVGAPPSDDPPPCRGTEKPAVEGVNEAFGAQAAPADLPATSGQDPPRWRKFVNVLSAVGQHALGTHQVGPANLDELGGSGGFLSNLDIAYVSAGLNRGFGPVAVTRLRAPTFPDTRPGTRRMPRGQLRYWSVCQNDPATQRFIACVNDDRAVLDGDGFATFVVTTPAARPANARRECGVNWLPWGPSQRGVLIYRHMLPAAGFTQSIQAAEPDREAATMGDSLPASEYLPGKAAFEARGC